MCETGVFRANYSSYKCIETSEKSIHNSLIPTVAICAALTLQVEIQLNHLCTTLIWQLQTQFHTEIPGIFTIFIVFDIPGVRNAMY